MATCKFPGCKRDVTARDVCIAHYKRLWRRGAFPKHQPRYRLTANGCLEWLGTRNTYGYAMKMVEAKLQRVSRLILAEKLGRAIRPNYCALHTCDNPPCVLADHIYEGTKADNAKDRKARGREDYSNPSRGSKHGRAILNESDIPIIRQKISQGQKFTHVADEFGVSDYAIHAIARRKTWRHV